MNSSKRGGVYGFKLASLDLVSNIGKDLYQLYYSDSSQLKDVRSSADKNYTLMHHLVCVVATHYPDLSNFCQDIKYLEKASSGMLHCVVHTVSCNVVITGQFIYDTLFLFCSVNLDNLGVDLRELVQGMKLATGELVHNKQNKKLKVCKQLLSTHTSLNCLLSLILLLSTHTHKHTNRPFVLSMSRKSPN